MLISELTQSAPLKTDLMELQRGNTSSNSTEVSQLMDAFAAETTALPYDPTATYSLGAYCIYGGVLYRCSTAIDTAEAWTVGHWTAVLITGEYMRVRIMHKAAYDALSADEKADGMIFVDDYDPNPYAHAEWPDPGQGGARSVYVDTNVSLDPEISISETGLYLVIACVKWNVGTNGTRSLWINSSLDGNSKLTTVDTSSGAVQMQNVAIMTLTAGAVVKSVVCQHSTYSDVEVTDVFLDVIKLK